MESFTYEEVQDQIEAITGYTPSDDETWQVIELAFDVYGYGDDFELKEDVELRMAVEVVCVVPFEVAPVRTWEVVA